MREKIQIFWHRRDLRIEDNAALSAASQSGFSVLPVFIFDTNILNNLPSNDARVSFLYETIHRLKLEYQKLGSDLLVFYSSPLQSFQELVSRYNVHQVYINKDYEPYALQRDNEIVSFLKANGIETKFYKDQVLLEPGEVIKDNGEPYTVFTPFSKKWKSTIGNVVEYKLEVSNLLSVIEKQPLVKLENIGFVQSNIPIPSSEINLKIVKDYEQNRDIPSINGTSRMGLHLRFGTISIRQLYLRSVNVSPKYVDELIWREFYFQIIFFFPYVVKSSFKKIYDNIEWRNNIEEFEKWKNGKTGVPIVDAGMRELNTTGFMHNRVRMIVASYLTKNLLIDWRWGESYFAEKLLDFELASNNGGWQWASGSGVDAAPYFRIFNPDLQTKRFDPNANYIRKWVPEYNSLSYINSGIVSHEFARKRCLETYKKALNG